MADSGDRIASEVGPPSELVVNFTQVAQRVFLAGGVELTLQAVVDLALTSIEGCDFSGIFILKAGRVTTPALTGPVVAELDTLQLALGEGPGLDSIAQKTTLYAEDLSGDPRWPTFGPAAAGTGVRSLLALYLAGEATMGALNLYARYPVAFGALDRARGVVLAGLAGLALGLAEAHEEEVRRAENLRQALVTRELIGQAQGILLERERITAEQAFEILRTPSSDRTRVTCDQSRRVVCQLARSDCENLRPPSLTGRGTSTAGADNVSVVERVLPRVVCRTSPDVGAVVDA